MKDNIIALTHSPSLLDQSGKEIMNAYAKCMRAHTSVSVLAHRVGRWGVIPLGCAFTICPEEISDANSICMVNVLSKFLFIRLSSH